LPAIAFSISSVSAFDPVDTPRRVNEFGEVVEIQPMIFERIPLMNGLKIIDRTDGSPHEVAVYKATAEAAGTVVAADIFDYYEYNLPKLGWDTVPGHRGYFINSSEELRIIPRNRQDILTVTFKLQR
jgi:hypothetical protein